MQTKGFSPLQPLHLKFLESLEPKPERVWELGYTMDDRHAIIEDGDSVVAILPDEKAGCTYSEERAKLMAAAPQLLAALQYIVAWSPNAWNAETARDLARKAIAAAV